MTNQTLERLVPQRLLSSTPGRSSGAFPTQSMAAKYWLALGIIVVLGAASAVGLLAYGNPMPFGTRGFWLLAERRMNAVIAIAIVAVAQAVATVAFQTVTNNRIITPSIMGFESLYVAIHTSTVFFLGGSGLVEARTMTTYIIQLVLMVGFALLLYSWLLTGKNANMHAMLLVGIIIGAGLGSVSTFMQRLLTPSDFDLLTARLFGSVNNAEPEYFPISIVLVAVAAGALLLMSRTLNVLALGPDATTNLGINHRGKSIVVLILVAVLMAVSTALVGPMASWDSWWPRWPISSRAPPITAMSSRWPLPRPSACWRARTS